MNTDAIAEYEKLHAKADAFWIVYAYEDDPVLEELYITHIDAVYAKLEELLSKMTDEELQYISRKENWAAYAD